MLEGLVALEAAQEGSRCKYGSRVSHHLLRSSTSAHKPRLFLPEYAGVLLRGNSPSSGRPYMGPCLC